MTKQNHLTLRLSDAETARLEMDAAAAGVSVSALVRAALRERADAERLVAALGREFQAQTDELVSKMKVLSDQIQDLAKIIIRSKQP